MSEFLKSRPLPNLKWFPGLDEARVQSLNGTLTDR